MKTTLFIFTALIFLFFISCEKQKPINKVSYSSKSDSALYYYNLGWQQIMDEGYYSKAEQSYRKVLEHDPDFLIGQSVLARLTRDLDERLELYANLEANKKKITGDERLILDVYIALTDFTNIREQYPDKAKDALSEVLHLADSNLKIIAHKYPNEVYLKAEYIEFLHSVYGPQASLDSLKSLTNNLEEIPFLLGYAATINAELENFDIALKHAKTLEQMMSNMVVPKPGVVYADIYFHMDSLEIAKAYIDKSYALDSLNVDASRLRAKIDNAIVLKNNNKDN